MLQALLEERFKLAVRWETRERPQYVLSFAGLVNPESPLLRPRFDCGDAAVRRQTEYNAQPDPRQNADAAVREST
jgi:uncharacterized protein (TIGR03435 family)